MLKLPGDPKAVAEITSRFPQKRTLQVFNSRVAATAVHKTHMTMTFQIISETDGDPAVLQLAFPFNDNAVFTNALVHGNLLTSPVTPQDTDPDTPDPNHRPTISFFEEEMEIRPLRSVLQRSQADFLDWGLPVSSSPMETDQPAAAAPEQPVADAAAPSEPDNSSQAQ